MSMLPPKPISPYTGEPKEDYEPFFPLPMIGFFSSIYSWFGNLTRAIAAFTHLLLSDEEEYRHGDRVLITSGIHRERQGSIYSKIGWEYGIDLGVGESLIWLSRSHFVPVEEQKSTDTLLPQSPPQGGSVIAPAALDAQNRPILPMSDGFQALTDSLYLMANAGKTSMVATHQEIEPYIPPAQLPSYDIVMPDEYEVS